MYVVLGFVHVVLFILISFYCESCFSVKILLLVDSVMGSDLVCIK